MSVPVGPDDLTPGWLSEVLGTTVTKVTVTPIGTGQTGSSYRVTVEHTADLPNSFVAKMGAEDPEVRTRVAHGYRAEVAFYDRIAPTVDVPVPRCFASRISEDGTVFVLLLADLAPAQQGDQIAGTTADVVLTGATALAGLHGPRWCDPTWKDLDVLTLPLVDESSAPGMGDLARMATDVFLADLGDRMSAEDRETFGNVPEKIPAWLLARPERFSLLHGDYRLDNLMVAPDGGVTVVDWQTLAVGLPARDLAYWVTTSVEPEVRRSVEHQAIAAYHAALAVPGYDLATCEEDYRVGQLHVPLIAALGWAFTTKTDRGGDMMLAMVRRSCAALRDLGTLESL